MLIPESNILEVQYFSKCQFFGEHFIYNLKTSKQHLNHNPFKTHKRDYITKAIFKTLAQKADYKN